MWESQKLSRGSDWVYIRDACTICCVMDCHQAPTGSLTALLFLHPRTVSFSMATCPRRDLDPNPFSISWVRMLIDRLTSPLHAMCVMRPRYPAHEDPDAGFLREELGRSESLTFGNRGAESSRSRNHDVILAQAPPFQGLGKGFKTLTPPRVC